MYTDFPDLYTGVGFICVPAVWPGLGAVLKQDAKIVLKALAIARKYGELLP